MLRQILELSPSPTRRLRLREIVRVRTVGHRGLLPVLVVVVIAAVRVLVIVPMSQDLSAVVQSADRLA